MYTWGALVIGLVILWWIPELQNHIAHGSGAPGAYIDQKLNNVIQRIKPGSQNQRQPTKATTFLVKESNPESIFQIRKNPTPKNHKKCTLYRNRNVGCCWIGKRKEMMGSLSFSCNFCFVFADRLEKEGGRNCRLVVTNRNRHRTEREGERKKAGGVGVVVGQAGAHRERALRTPTLGQPSFERVGGKNVQGRAPLVFLRFSMCWQVALLPLNHVLKTWPTG